MSKKLLTETAWKNVVDNPDEYEAFVYLIVNKLNGKKYIGRKFTKKRNRIKNKNSSTGRKKLIVSESDWRYYKSSSDTLKHDIDKYGEDNFDFIVLEWCKTRASAMYLEVEYQIKNDVLTKKLENTDEFEYYNNNILSRYFRPKEPGTVEYETKCRNISEALKAGFKNGNIVHPMRGKIHPNRGKKLPQTGHDKNFGKTWYTNGKTNLFLKEDDGVPSGYVPGLTKINPDQKSKYINKYLTNPKRCLNCGKILTYEDRKRSYCTSTCQNYKHRLRMSKKWKSNPALNMSFAGVIVTPFGKFFSYKSAALAENTTIYKLKKKILTDNLYQFVPKKEIPQEWLDECI